MVEYRVTYLRGEVLATMLFGVKATYARAEALGSVGYELRVSYVRAEAIGSVAYDLRTSALRLEVLCRINVPMPYALPRNTLPWTVPPDWRNGVTERLSWKTDVLTGQNGTEQRRQLRLSPRLTIEADYTIMADDRRLVDALLSGPANTLWQVPLWWEQYPLTQAALAGDTVILLDCAFTTLMPGDTVMVLGNRPYEYELGIVKSIAPDSQSIVLAYPLAAAWRQNTTVYRTKKCRLSEATSMTRKADNAGTIKLTFDSLETQDYAEFGPLVPFNGEAVLVLFYPNFANDLTADYQRLYSMFDPLTGKSQRRDLGRRAFHVMQYEYLGFTRQDAAAFRLFLYWLRGKMRQLYVQTYSNDIRMVPGSVVADGGTSMFVMANGYSQYLVGQPDRECIVFVFKDGHILIRKIIGAGVAPGVTYQGQPVDFLTLDQGVIGEVASENISRISFLQLVRQDQDDISITHLVDGRGPSNFATTFRSVGPARTAVTYSVVFDGNPVRNVNPPVIPVTIETYVVPTAGETPPVAIVMSVDTAGDGNDSSEDGGNI